MSIEQKNGRRSRIEASWFARDDQQECKPYLSDAFAWEVDIGAQQVCVMGFWADTTNDMSLTEAMESLHPEDAARFRGILAGGVEPGHTIEYKIRVRIDGAYGRFHVRGCTFSAGGTIAAAGVAFDTECSKEYIKRLEFLETHDELTGLVNAPTLDRRYDGALQKGAVPQALIVASIDDLKEVNETMGYHAGNKLIQSVADVFRECFFDAEIIARIGGGEFCAAFFGTERSEVEHRINEATMQLYKTYLNLVKAHVTFGCAASDEKLDFSAIYSRALAHMKKAGRIKRVLSEPCVVDPLNEIIAQRAGWGKRVARLASLGTQVGAALGCSEEELTEIRVLSRIVDIGLVGVEERLLKNRTHLSGRDRQEYLRHIDIGREIISSHDALAFMEPLYTQTHASEDGPIASVSCGVMAAVLAFDDIAFERGDMEGIRDWLRRQEPRYGPEVVDAMLAVTAGRS